MWLIPVMYRLLSPSPWLLLWLLVFTPHSHWHPVLTVFLFRRHRFPSMVYQSTNLCVNAQQMLHFHCFITGLLLPDSSYLHLNTTWLTRWCWQQHGGAPSGLRRMDLSGTQQAYASLSTPIAYRTSKWTDTREHARAERRRQEEFQATSMSHSLIKWSGSHPLVVDRGTHFVLGPHQGLPASLPPHQSHVALLGLFLHGTVK